MEFQVQLKSDPSVLFQNIRSLSGNRMKIIGDVNSGRFHGLFCGEYALQGQTARIRIQRKPRFVPWDVISLGIHRLDTIPEVTRASCGHLKPGVMLDLVKGRIQFRSE